MNDPPEHCPLSGASCTCTCMYRARTRGECGRTVRPSTSRCCGRDLNRGQLQEAKKKKKKSAACSSIALAPPVRRHERWFCMTVTFFLLSHVPSVRFETCELSTIEGVTLPGSSSFVPVSPWTVIRALTRALDPTWIPLAYFAHRDSLYRSNRGSLWSSASTFAIRWLFCPGCDLARLPEYRQLNQDLRLDLQRIPSRIRDPIPPKQLDNIACCRAEIPSCEDAP